MPLRRELETIQRRRADRSDVILIDDPRIYELGSFDSKNLDEIGLAHIAEYGNLDLSAVERTHQIERLYRDDGYVVLLPRREFSPT